MKQRYRVISVIRRRAQASCAEKTSNYKLFSSECQARPCVRVCALLVWRKSGRKAGNSMERKSLAISRVKIFGRRAPSEQLQRGSSVTAKSFLEKLKRPSLALTDCARSEEMRASSLVTWEKSGKIRRRRWGFEKHRKTQAVNVYF